MVAEASKRLDLQDGDLLGEDAVRERSAVDAGCVARTRVFVRCDPRSDLGDAGELSREVVLR